MEDNKSQRDERKIMRVSVINPELKAKQMKSECCLEREVSADRKRKILAAEIIIKTLE